MRTVVVSPEGGAPYAVRIGRGLIGRLGAEVAPLLARPRTLVVSDETVARLYGAAALASLRKAAVDAEIVAVPAGEGSKSFAELERLCDAMAGRGLDRKDAIIALGGGVVGDLAGFAAAVYMRGIGVVQVPTTLLSQVDSSVGGKTAIDTPRGKNLVGAFWQPRLVLADVDVLDTLPERELRAGWAEVLKYGLIGDADLFDRLAASGPLDRDGREDAVAASVEAKARIVAEDPREAGRRALLNLGHTFGHALEAESGFGDALLHGEAVGLGMALAFRFSADQGLCPPGEAERACAAIAAAGLPTRLESAQGAPYSAAALLAWMARDKKSVGGRLTLVLARRIGDALVVRDVDPDALATFLVKEGARP